MPSRSLVIWSSRRQQELDELEAAHQGIGGTGRGRRFATNQINQAYAVILSSQFQGFCRDLHEESVDLFVQQVTNPLVSQALRQMLMQSRKLDSGNPNPGNIGNDYNRMGILFWEEVKSLDVRNTARRERLEELNTWRNAIAHQDFDPSKLGGIATLQLKHVRAWRNACDQLAASFDEVMRQNIQRVSMTSPW